MQFEYPLLMSEPVYPGGEARFEVLKVRSYLTTHDYSACLVASCRAMVMGYSSGQLCHLQESHHGSLVSNVRLTLPPP